MNAPLWETKTLHKTGVVAMEGNEMSTSPASVCTQPQFLMSGKGQRQDELNQNDHIRLTINYLDRMMELIEATHDLTFKDYKILISSFLYYKIK